MTLRKKIENNLFPSVFILFIVSGYLLRPTPTWAIIFYAILVPATFIIYIKNKNLFIENFQNTIFTTSVILILWFLLTISWGVNQPDFNVKKYIARSITNLIFLFTAAHFFSLPNEKWKKTLFKYLPYAVFINITISIVVFYAVNENPLNQRMIGWAETRHPILGSLVILTGFCITYYQSQIATTKIEKVTYAAICISCGIFIILTQSRGPLLTLLFICASFTVFSGKTVRWLMLGTLVFLLAVFTFNDEIQRQVLQSLSRNPWRFEIWMDAWKYIQNAPIIGNGLASLNTFGAIEQKFPHSIYVSSAFFGGAIGLFLLLALFAQLAWAALNTEDKTTKAFHLGLLCVPVIGGLTDLAQVSKSPGELWYILWVPVTIIIGHSIKSRREQKQQAQQSSIE
ncbi:O-antigen ligase family protein [Thalassospira xiamenensis]|uniref:O-antigen ligase-related domain-containing protein n=1 Tax=Thalassospira xiamenensis TaxID=220697 RepID=A0A367X1J0_9PROT|nr:O-antigen ligase family protein [Thalassospira xiamenensis]KZB56139.1 hypothetical protein AUP41_15470 [Thalassospira xiamenensis]MCK2166053.1 O-antigen ligase family protein [Thalassospira xiamenensis]RCK47517.1 hypothetical protein TH44_17795 [Thalassospira xiamenensis]